VQHGGSLRVGWLILIDRRATQKLKKMTGSPALATAPEKFVIVG
jgi:hypothetical protein